MMGNWGWDGGWHLPFFGMGPFLFLAIIAAIAYYMFRRRGADEVNSRGPSARDILDRRYAAGEVTKEQYDTMKRDLAS